jgi:hypothetical protein
MKIRPWLAGTAGATAVILGLGTSASATTHHPARWAPSSFAAAHLHLPGLRPNTTFFGNWAGYIAFADKNVTLRYVAANFNLPSLNCVGAAPNASFVMFVGFQDWNAPGELTGIQGTCNSDGTFSYQAGFNIGSGGGTATGTINPGDAIQASVYYNASTKKYTFFLNDVTEGTPLFNTTVSCPSGSKCSNSTAEAVTDVAADQSGSILPLANYGMNNFTGGTVTSLDGLRGGFSSSKLWNGAESIMRSSAGTILATPSSLEGGAAFNTTWHASS